MVYRLFSDRDIGMVFCPPDDHIGASGIIYGLAAFLFFGGLFRKDNRLRAVSLIILIYYGGIFWGVFPIDPHISWEGHLFGACSGIFAAFIYRKSNLKNMIGKKKNLIPTTGYRIFQIISN